MKDCRADLDASNNPAPWYLPGSPEPLVIGEPRPDIFELAEAEAAVMSLGSANLRRIILSGRERTEPLSRAADTALFDHREFGKPGRSGLSRVVKWPYGPNETGTISSFRIFYRQEPSQVNPNTNQYFPSELRVKVSKDPNALTPDSESLLTRPITYKERYHGALVNPGMYQISARFRHDQKGKLTVNTLGLEFYSPHEHLLREWGGDTGVPELVQTFGLNYEPYYRKYKIELGISDPSILIEATRWRPTLPVWGSAGTLAFGAAAFADFLISQGTQEFPYIPGIISLAPLAFTLLHMKNKASSIYEYRPQQDSFMLSPRSEGANAAVRILNDLRHKTGDLPGLQFEYRQNHKLPSVSAAEYLEIMQTIMALITKD